MKNNIKKNVAINIAIGSVILFSGNLFAQSLADQYGVQIIENNTPNVVNYRGIDVPLIANSDNANTNNAPNCPKFVIGGSAMSTNCINSSGNYVDSSGNVNNSNNSGNSIDYRGIDVPLITNSNNTNNAPNCPKFAIGGSAKPTNCINSSGNYVDSSGNVNNPNSSGNSIDYRGIDVPLIANSNDTNNAPNCPKFAIGGSAKPTNCINSSGNYIDNNGNVNNSNNSGNNATGVVAGVIGAGVIGSFADNIGTDAVIENGKQMSDNLTKLSAVGVDASIKELDRISDLAALQSSAPQYDLRFGPTPTGDVFAFCSGLRPGKYSPWRYWYDYLCANTQKSYDLR